MKWLKAGLVGALGSLVMALIMFPAIAMGVAPFNQPPSAAFLDSIGMKVGPLPLIVHFGYGIFWSIVFVALFAEKANLARGVALALTLWLLMMILYSPMIGWGPFGFGDAGTLPEDDPLYLAPGPKYLVATFVLHLVYGAVIGWLNPLWVGADVRGPR